MLEDALSDPLVEAMIAHFGRAGRLDEGSGEDRVRLWTATFRTKTSARCGAGGTTVRRLNVSQPDRGGLASDASGAGTGRPDDGLMCSKRDHAKRRQWIRWGTDRASIARTSLAGWAQSRRGGAS